MSFSFLIGPSFQGDAHAFAMLMTCIFTRNHGRRLSFRKEEQVSLWKSREEIDELEENCHG